MSTATTKRAPSMAFTASWASGKSWRGSAPSSTRPPIWPRLAASRIPAVVRPGPVREGDAPVVLVPGPTGVERRPGPGRNPGARPMSRAPCTLARRRAERKATPGRPASIRGRRRHLLLGLGQRRAAQDHDDRGRVRAGLFPGPGDVGPHDLDGRRRSRPPPRRSPAPSRPRRRPGRRPRPGGRRRSRPRRATGRWAPGSARRSGCRARAPRRAGAGRARALRL